jgi:pyruvate formate lyase activating enzyme
MRARRASVADVIRFSWVDGPGNRFVVFFQGCNFDCLACHNPQTIPLHSAHARELSVADLVEEIRGSMPYVSGLTVSGGEATLQAEFVTELFAAVKADAELGRLTTFIDSNGSASAATWEQLAPVTDGVMVDLKALDPDRHLELTGQPNDAVLASILRLRDLDRLYEVRLLLAPGQNDGEDDLRRTAAWLIAVDPEVRVKVNGFRHHGVRAVARTWAEATDEDLEGYRRLLRDAGLRTVV